MEMNIADKIDHTMLKADASEETIRRYCREAAAYGFASVCVNSCHVLLVSQLLEGTGVKVCCVAGFPPGGHEYSGQGFREPAGGIGRRGRGGYGDKYRRVKGRK